MPRPPDPNTLGELKAAVGSGSWLEEPEAVAPFLSDFRRLYHGATPLVLLPRDVGQVAQILRICNREEVAGAPPGPLFPDSKRTGKHPRRPPIHHHTSCPPLF